MGSISKLEAREEMAEAGGAVLDTVPCWVHVQAKPTGLAHRLEEGSKTKSVVGRPWRFPRCD